MKSDAIRVSITGTDNRGITITTLCNRSKIGTSDLPDGSGIRD